MSIAAALKGLNRKTITLPLSDPATGEPLQVTIRRVSGGEVTARAGSPLTLLALARGGDPNETDEQRRERLLQQALSEPETFAGAFEYGQKLQRAVVCLGVVSEKVVERPESELGVDEIRPEHFGDALPVVYNAILEFSDLPYQPMELADLRRFRREPVAGDDARDGEGVRN